MSSEKLYYKKYLKYKQKYKNLQSYIGGSPPEPSPIIKRSMSFTCSNQGDQGTCFAHVLARIFANLIKMFFLNHFNYTVDCSYFYNTISCNYRKRLLDKLPPTNIFDCFITNSLRNERCNNYQEHISALLFNFIYTILTIQFGCNTGSNPFEVVSYFLTYIKNTVITIDLIKTILRYNRKKHYEYLYLIKKLVNIINKTKKDLFNDNLKLYCSWLNQIQAVSNIEKDFTTTYTHPLSKLLKTNDLKTTLQFILINGYYATFSYDGHIVLIVDYDAINDALVIKNSYGYMSPITSTKWCSIIKNNRILFSDLNKLTNSITFLYYDKEPSPIYQFPNIKLRLEEIKKFITKQNTHLNLEQQITEEDMEDCYIYLDYISLVLKEIHRVEVDEEEINILNKELLKLEKIILKEKKSERIFSEELIQINSDSSSKLPTLTTLIVTDIKMVKPIPLKPKPPPLPPPELASELPHPPPPPPPELKSELPPLPPPELESELPPPPPHELKSELPHLPHPPAPERVPVRVPASARVSAPERVSVPAPKRVPTSASVRVPVPDIEPDIKQYINEIKDYIEEMKPYHVYKSELLSYLNSSVETKNLLSEHSTYIDSILEEIKSLIEKNERFETVLNYNKTIIESIKQTINLCIINLYLKDIDEYITTINISLETYLKYKSISKKKINNNIHLLSLHSKYIYQSLQYINFLLNYNLLTDELKQRKKKLNLIEKIINSFTISIFLVHPKTPPSMHPSIPIRPMPLPHITPPLYYQIFSLKSKPTSSTLPIKSLTQVI